MKVERLTTILSCLLALGCYRRAGSPEDAESSDPPAPASDTMGTGGDIDLDTDTDVDSDTDTSTAVSDCCLVAHIVWGTDCMADHIDPFFVLPSCGEVIEEPSDYTCVPILSECDDGALIDANRINAVIESDDFRAVLEEGNQGYGVGTFPYYGVTLSFAGSDETHSLGIGSPCTDEYPSCIPIPESVAELRLLLDTIVDDRDTYPLIPTPSGLQDDFCEYHL
jgi:hypothetical protein